MKSAEGRTEAGKPLYSAILLASFLIYSTVWSISVLLRYYSYNAGIFDLGLASNLLFRLGHGGFYYIFSFPTPVPFNKLIALVLAIPYLVSYNAAWLLVFQSVWIGAGVFPLYRISRHYLKNEAASLMFSVSYLLYYPLAGVNWFDFHFMAMFPTAFVLCVMFKLEEREKMAILSGAIAVISDFLIPLTMLFYVLYLLAERKRQGNGLRPDSFMISMTALSLLVFLSVNMIFGTGFTTQYLHLSGASYSTAYVAPLSEKVTYFYAMLLPLLFLSVLGLDFLAVGIPFFALVFINSYEPYVSTMYFQYPALIAPVIFISAVIGLGRIVKFLPKDRKRSLKSISAVILLVNVILFSFFTPIGNIYTDNIYNPHYGKYISGNSFQYSGVRDLTITKYDRYLAQISGAIPVGSPILIQNNMPQLAAGYNWELPGFRETGFVPQYVVIDPYSMFYDQFSAAYHTRNMTMAQMANYYVHTGNYSTEYSMGGVVLLQKNSSGKMASFIPVYMNLSVRKSDSTSFQVHGYSTNATVLEGTLPFLEPGVFSLLTSYDNGSALSEGSYTVSFVSESNFSEIPCTFTVLQGGIEEVQVMNFSGPAIVILGFPSHSIPDSILLGISQISAGIPVRGST